MNTTPLPTVDPTLSARPQHILVPVDFSAPCEHGVAAAVGLALRFSAKLTFIHVVQHVPHGSAVAFEAVGIQQLWRGPAQEKLAQFIAEHVPEEVRRDDLVVEGKPFEEVVKLAADWKCDLIVVATHGYTGLVRVLLGSTAERIVQHAPCPVLVVRGRPTDDTPAAAQPLNFRWMLLATDFSDNSLAAFPLAAAMAQEFQAKLTLTYVNPILPMPYVHAGVASFESREPLLKAQREEAETHLRNLCSDHFPALSVEILVLEGVPHRMLAEAARSDYPGLIILATHGQTGWKHALMGSTAEQVVRHAPCPVLVVRSPEP